jgi:hypothetical protein
VWPPSASQWWSLLSILLPQLGVCCNRCLQDTTWSECVKTLIWGNDFADFYCHETSWCHFARRPSCCHRTPFMLQYWTKLISYIGITYKHVMWSWCVHSVDMTRSHAIVPPIFDSRVFVGASFIRIALWPIFELFNATNYHQWYFIWVLVI